MNVNNSIGLFSKTNQIPNPLVDGIANNNPRTKNIIIGVKKIITINLLEIL